MSNLLEAGIRESDLKARSVRGASLTLFAQLTQVGLRTVSMIVLARLISPEGYGIVAMVSAVTAFAMLFQDLGISAAAIQARELTHRQVSTLFWLNVAVGTFLTLAVAASAPLVVWFYDEPAVFGATIATSFIFVIGSLGNQHSVLLRRAMRFKA
ncbi:MAG TPA: oligosaccharide flippase family protein, partial [Steroidobacteraceae bacterium]